MNKMFLSSLVYVVALTYTTVFVALTTCTVYGAEPIEMPLPDDVKTIEVGANAEIKTLEDALNHVAEIRKTDKTTPLALRVAPGDYMPGKTLKFTAEYTSIDMAPLFIYAADFSKKPRIHGGAPITNWQKTTFNGRSDVWYADVSALELKGRPNILCLNGQRYRFARWPNLEPAYPYTSGYTPADMRRKSKDTLEGFYEDELQIRPEDVRAWAHPEDARVVAYPRHGYHTRTINIREIKDGVMYLDCKHTEITHHLHLWNCWYVENVAEELDAPGEWYYDPRAQKVYLIPLEGVDLNNSVVTVAQSGPVIQFEKCGNCTFAGLEIVGGANQGIEILDSDYLNFRACTIHDIGSTGVWIRGAFVEVTDCDLYNCASYGIFLHSYHTDRLVTGRNGVVLENNYIHDCHCGIFNAGQGTRISHNLIHDTRTSAISGYGRFCDISYNRIRHSCIMADDTGALYDSGWGGGCQTKIRYNWISDTIGHKFSGGNHTFFWDAACGIYFDETSGGADVYGNLIARAHMGGMHLHCARWLNVYNNIFVSNASTPTSIYSRQLSISDWNKTGFGGGRRDLHVGEYNWIIKMDPNWAQFPSISQDANTDAIYADDGAMMMGNKFQNNIFYYPGQSGSGRMLNASSLNLKENVFNKNVYWSGREPNGKIKEVWMNTGREDGMTYQSWLDAGQDADSVVEDPLFVNPSKDDYRLKPDSPALKLGFVELPFDEMGLKKSHFRPELPQEADGLREHPEWLKMPEKK
ncbi:MAG: right-handed parallel beta-helix repeat-containing protein [Planctomycetia bacterium]|nr:right-handed parallel beta-helix repeat-containing protein [Planctomycetia bacterium]